MPILNWLNREQSIKKAAQASYRLLELDENFSYGNKDSKNMLIQGDNLEALKALLPYFAGKVKCVYIDPPYNTGSAFEHSYNTGSAFEYYGDNLEHTKWLEMMYPRLELLCELLAEDGSIFVHLDDNESDYLKVILDEIFGRKNFVNRITVDARSPSAFSTVNPGVFKSSEYVIWYAKNKNSFLEKPLRIKRQPDYAYDKWIENPNEDCSKWIFSTLSEAYDKIPKPKTTRPEKLLNHYNEFIIKNAEHIWRPTEISNTGAGKATIKKKEESILFPNKALKVDREKYEPIYIRNGKQISFYSKNISKIDGALSATTLLTNVWTDIAWEGIASEGGVVFKKSKKPERLIRRIFQLTTNEGDLVLDSFLGSGTTAAVAHKMNRRYIGIEMGEHAKTHCALRLQKVIEGEQGGISKDVAWVSGGGFRFYNLGEAIFNEDGCINKNIKFEHLAAHIWFSETKTPLSQKEKSALLGIFDGVAYYLLFNGILGDKSVSGGNVLTKKTLSILPKFDGPKIIYGETNRLAFSLLQENQITFKQTPYDIKAR
jgi:adenine-specific DNA-methyltransferase